MEVYPQIIHFLFGIFHEINSPAIGDPRVSSRLVGSGLIQVAVIPKWKRLEEIGKENHHQISRDLLFHLFGDDDKG